MNGKCKECNKPLIVPSWKYCQGCELIVNKRRSKESYTNKRKKLRALGIKRKHGS